MAAAADKRARRKEDSSSIRPEFGNHTCHIICNKDCHSHIGLFRHNQFAYMFVFVKQNILTNRKDRRRLPNRGVLSAESGVFLVPFQWWLLADTFSVIQPPKRMRDKFTGYARYLLLLLLLCKAAFYFCIIARWRSGQEELVRSWTTIMIRRR